MNGNAIRRLGFRSLLVIGLLFGASFVLAPVHAEAENRCSAVVTRGGKRFDLRLRPGGKLSGRMVGSGSSWGTTYSWTAEFELRLPNESSPAGMNGCDATD